MKQFLSRHWLILIIIGFLLIGLGVFLYFVVFKAPPIKEQIQIHEDQWKAQNINSYRIRVQTLYPVGTDIYEVVVRDGQVSERICIQRCMVARGDYTVPKLFQVAHDTPEECDEDNPKGCLVIKYDATYGYPTLIKYDPGCCDRGFNLTVLSFEVLK